VHDLNDIYVTPCETLKWNWC